MDYHNLLKRTQEDNKGHKISCQRIKKEKITKQKNKDSKK